MNSKISFDPYESEQDNWLPPPRNEVHRALYKLLARIQIAPADRSLASQYQTMVREMLRKSLGGVKHDFLSGSYARHTAIRPLHDVDMIVVLDGEKRARLRSENPRKTLYALYSALNEAFDRHPTGAEILNRAVCIRFLGGQMKIDVVPAFENSNKDLLEIPDHHEMAWVHTDPKWIITESRRLNRESGNLLKPIVKFIKKWRFIWNIKLKSFHVELMCNAIDLSQISEIDQALYVVFTDLSENVLLPCRDPARPSVDLSSYLTDWARRNASYRFRTAAKYAKDALASVRQGNLIEAHGFWRQIFEGNYPE